MISSEVERRATLAAIQRFEQALAHLDTSEPEGDPFLHELMRDQIEGEVEALRAQVAEYDARRAKPSWRVRLMGMTLGARPLYHADAGGTASFVVLPRNDVMARPGITPAARRESMGAAASARTL